MEHSITEIELAQFAQQGFLVLKNFANAEVLSSLQADAQQWLAAPQSPFELELETGYPGAPSGKNALGANTTRRILQAFDRSSAVQSWCANTKLLSYLHALLGGEKLFLTRAHHNCLMTKAPRFSSDTGWHQDIRYWSFNNAELISTWLALGTENVKNGGLRVIPGSHRIQYLKHMFDERIFFKTDLDENKHLLDTAIEIELEAGDVLLFHAKLLHSASRNTTEQTKLSLVFTYHNEQTLPEPGSRSSLFDPIDVTPNTAC